MIFWCINTAVFIFGMSLYFVISVNAATKFKKRYPNIKLDKSHWSVAMTGILRMLILFAIPLLNTHALLVLVFKSDDFIESAIDELYQRCVGAE